jgi:hypothetical protein
VAPFAFALGFLGSKQLPGGGVNLLGDILEAADQTGHVVPRFSGGVCASSEIFAVSAVAEVEAGGFGLAPVGARCEVEVWPDFWDVPVEGIVELIIFTSLPLVSEAYSRSARR